MSVSTGTIDNGGRALFSSKFLEFCAKMRKNDPSIMPEAGKPFKIPHLTEKEATELADALLENISVTRRQRVDRPLVLGRSSCRFVGAGTLRFSGEMPSSARRKRRRSIRQQLVVPEH
jgi:hypothetical protein